MRCCCRGAMWKPSWCLASSRCAAPVQQPFVSSSSHSCLCLAFLTGEGHVTRAHYNDCCCLAAVSSSCIQYESTCCCCCRSETALKRRMCQGSLGVTCQHCHPPARRSTSRSACLTELTHPTHSITTQLHNASIDGLPTACYQQQCQTSEIDPNTPHEQSVQLTAGICLALDYAPRHTGWRPLYLHDWSEENGVRDYIRVQPEHVACHDLLCVSCFW